MTKSTIPQVARKKGYSEADLHTLWLEYRELIVWDDKFCRATFETEGAVDEKDIPYVELEKRIQAAGILSRDKDVKQLGGRALGLEFVLRSRRYARSETCFISIYVNGTFLGAMGFAVLSVILRGVGLLVSRLPDWGRCILIVSVVTAVLHPKSRQYIFDKLASLEEAGTGLLPQILALIEFANQEHENAEKTLLETKELIVR